MLSYKALVDDATKQLYEVGDTPRIDAEVLMQHVTQRPIAWLIAYGDSTASPEHTKAFYQLVGAREQGQPIAYLTGSREFWSLDLLVNEHVLIPRPDTETLVEHALERLPTGTKLTVLDLGTGSGAVALSIAKERPEATVIAVDSQAKALNVAKLNAERNSIGNTQFIQSNWFDNIDCEQRFDLIASNPPYVEHGDPHLEKGDLRFEPDTALIASENGLADLKTIIQTAPAFLTKNGWLIVEHGYNQADAVSTLFSANGFHNIELFRDINNLARCTAGQWT